MADAEHTAPTGAIRDTAPTGAIRDTAPTGARTYPAPTLSLTTDGPDRTRALAAALASHLEVGDLLVLTGDLGAGKTCFTQGLGRGLGIDDRITSPTFTLAGRYRGRLTLHHLDVYRLESVAETMDLDLPDLLESGVTVIEWGEQILSVLPDQYLLVALCFPRADPSGADHPGPGAPSRFDATDFDESVRLIELVGHGRRWHERWPELVAAVGEWAP